MPRRRPAKAMLKVEQKVRPALSYAESIKTTREGRLSSNSVLHGECLQTSCALTVRKGNSRPIAGIAGSGKLTVNKGAPWSTTTQGLTTRLDLAGLRGKQPFEAN